MCTSRITSCFRVSPPWRTSRGRIAATHHRICRKLMKFTVCLLFGMSVAAQTGTPAALASSPQQGLPDAGRHLFTGTVHFKNGGPACVACHNVAGLDFPGGGNMGPDLTGAYAKLGPDGLNSAL